MLDAADSSMRYRTGGYDNFLRLERVNVTHHGRGDRIACCRRVRIDASLDAQVDVVAARGSCGRGAAPAASESCAAGALNCNSEWA